MGKKIKQGQGKIIEGLVKAVDTVKVTLGPAGHCVAISDDFQVSTSRDGANILKTICFDDPELNMGAELVKKASTNTESESGDSTTSCSILTKELVLGGQKAVQTGSNVNEIKSGMLKAGKWMNEYIKTHAIKIEGDLEKIRKVATISANNDPEIGDLIVKCMKEVGEEGVITSELGKGLETTIDITKGMRLNRGWSSPHYVTNPEEGKCILSNPYIIVCGEKISSVNQILPIIEVIEKAPRPFLIICDDMDENVNATLVMNTLQGAIRCCVIKGIDFGDSRKNLMADISIACGGSYICQENGISLNNITAEDFGAAEKVIVSRDNTIIVNGYGNDGDIKARLDILKKRIYSADMTDYEKNKLESRIANLGGGIAIIRAGAATEVESKNKKETIEDAILASKSAIEEGCLPGSGYTYYTGAKEMMKDKKFLSDLQGDELEGVKIVEKSLPCIMRTIIENSGESPDLIIDAIKKSKKENYGYNAKTKKLGDLLENGILDSAKAVRAALNNAISTAGIILQIDCCVIEDREKKNE